MTKCAEATPRTRCLFRCNTSRPHVQGAAAVASVAAAARDTAAAPRVRAAASAAAVTLALTRCASAWPDNGDRAGCVMLLCCALPRCLVAHVCQAVPAVNCTLKHALCVRKTNGGHLKHLVLGVMHSCDERCPLWASCPNTADLCLREWAAELCVCRCCS